MQDACADIPNERWVHRAIVRTVNGRVEVRDGKGHLLMIFINRTTAHIKRGSSVVIMEVQRITEAFDH